MKIKAILATTLDGAIGRDGGLVFNSRIKSDMRHFKNYTMGSIVVMGVTTYMSLPKKGLPGREMVVLSRSGRKIEGVPVFDSIESCINHYKDDDRDLIIIGGAELFNWSFSNAEEISWTLIWESGKDFKADTFINMNGLRGVLRDWDGHTEHAELLYIKDVEELYADDRKSRIDICIYRNPLNGAI